jgi:hypothetical protein
MLIIAAAGVGQQPLDDAELSRHLTVVRTQIADLSIDPVRREQLVFDMAATLDRAAQAVTDPEKRRQRWALAIDLIDRFSRENADLPLARQLRFQAAVFRWAQAQTWFHASQAEPAETRFRDRAVALLDDAIERLRSVSTIGDRTTLGENQRFRLAQALADRAELEPAGSDDRRTREAEARKLLQTPATEVGLAGYWHLLQADLARRAGEMELAFKELDAAARAKPAPPERDRFDVEIPLRISRDQFGEALRAVDQSHLDAAMKGLWKVRIHLAQLAGAAQGVDRARIVSDLFREIAGLRKGRPPELRIALLALARAGIEPGTEQSPEAWDAMAEAYQAAGSPEQAGRAALRAADRAAALGQSAEAAGARLRAGAFFYQANKFREADAALSRVVEDPAAGSSRARAGMLRALARGRAVALHLPGSSIPAYAEALERQIRDFPREPATDEARWLLAELAMAAGDRNRALSLWKAISPSATRWRDARLAIAAIQRDELERQLINPDRHVVREQFAQADKFLDESLKQARGEDVTAALLLARARLNLTPTTTHPEVTKEICDRIARMAVVPAIHYRARLLNIIAQIELGRYAEAEREAQTHLDWNVPAERTALFDAIRLLDHSATTAATDLRQRRFGLVLRLLIEPILTRDRDYAPDQLIELKMRLTRAMLFVGADADARRSLSSWRGTPPATDDRILRDLGDTYSRLEIYSLDIDVQRLRLQNNPAGSIGWFDARYALALAYYHTGQLKEAAQLIDATAILHPDLGGGELYEKFIRLSQRLGTKP